MRRSNATAFDNPVYDSGPMDHVEYGGFTVQNEIMDDDDDDEDVADTAPAANTDGYLDVASK